MTPSRKAEYEGYARRRAFKRKKRAVIRDLYFVGKLKQYEIGRMFGLRQGSVSRIVSGQVW